MGLPVDQIYLAKLTDLHTCQYGLVVIGSAQYLEFTGSSLGRVEAFSTGI